MSGTLTVKPLSAKLKRDTSTLGKMDPCCKVKVGSDIQLTAIHKEGGRYPAWRDELRFQRTSEDILELFLFDGDPEKKNLIGEATIYLQEIMEKKKELKWFTISYKGSLAGEVYIEFLFAPDSQEKQNQQLFGGTSMMMGNQGMMAMGKMTNQQIKALAGSMQNVYTQPIIQQPIIQQPLFQQQSMMQQQPIIQQSMMQPNPQQQMYLQPNMMYQQQQFYQQPVQLQYAPPLQQQQQQQFYYQQK